MKKKKIQSLLNLANDMIEEGKISEALEFLNSLEPVDKYTERQKTVFYMLNGKIHILLSNYLKAYESTEKGMLFAKKIEKCIEVVDLFLNMASILFFLGKYMESMILLEESSEILKNLIKISEKDRKRRIGIINLIKSNNFLFLGETMNAIEILKDTIDLLKKWGSQDNLAKAYSLYGNIYRCIGEYNKALNMISKSQKICENKESPQYNSSKFRNIIVSSFIYNDRGELQLALEGAKKGLSLARKYNNPIFIFMGLNNLGLIYQELGEWEQAIKNLKEALSITENMQSISSLVHLLDSFFQVYINMGDITAAQQIFNQIEQLKDKKKEDKGVILIYRLNRAILMKMSKRTRDLGVAQEIFKNIIQDEVRFLELTQIAILNLCEMLINEFKETKNVEALDELASLLKQLQETSEKQHSYKMLAETYLLDAKLSMIDFNLKKARQSLTKAQQIAEKYGINRLAMKISNEHDKLLQNLEIWEQMKEENVSISERLEKIEINDQILTMLKKKPAEIPEISPESPILLLIMGNSGIPIYTKIFNNEWKISEELFSGFLSAFNSFSNEIFSEGLDRANFGKFTILMSNMPPFMSCYVFEGQSFLAHQKFSNFNENIHESEQIWEKLNFANRTGLLIQDDSSLGLAKIVKTIF